MNLVIYNIIRKIAFWSLSFMYNWLDKNKDGLLDKEELEQAYKEIKVFLGKYKK